MKNTKIAARLSHFSRYLFYIDLIRTAFTACTLSFITFLVLLLYLKPFWLVAIAFSLPFLFLRRRSLLKTARYLEEREPKLVDRLVNAYQLSAMPDASKENYSRELIDAAVSQTEEIFMTLDLRSYVDRTKAKQGLLTLLISVLLVLSYAALQPARFYYGLTHQLEVNVKPKGGEQIRGSDLELSIDAVGPYLPARAGLEISDRKGRTEFPISLEDGHGHKTIKVGSDFKYRFLILDKVTPFFKIDLSEPMVLKDFRVTYDYPDYTRLAPATNSQHEVIALKGTQLTIEGIASKEIDRGFLFMKPDTYKVRLAGSKFTAGFTVEASGEAKVLLYGKDSLIEAIPVTMVPDLAPLIDVSSPGFDVDLPVDMTLPLVLRAVDDFGLSRIELAFKLKDDEKRIVLARPVGMTEETLIYSWNLSTIKFLPGDEITYYLEAWDNDGYSGAKSAKSEIFRVRFPTVEQIYKEVADKESGISRDFEILDARQEKLQDELAKIEEKVRREKKLDWSDQKSLEGVVNQQKEVISKAEAWVKELERTVEKMNEGLIMDKDAVQKLQEISQLLQQVLPEDFDRLMEKLQDALNKDIPELTKTLKELKLSQEEVKKGLERTLEILKRFHQEEKLKELAKKAEELLQQQQTIDRIKQLEEKAESQKKIKQGLEEMKREMAGLAADQELEPEIAEELEKLLREMEQKKTIERAENLASMFQQGEAERASKDSKELQLDLEKMKEALAELYKSMTEQRRQEVASDIMRRINDLLTVSRKRKK